MSEPIAIVTIKLTEAELKLINKMIGIYISDWQDKEKLMPAKYTLQEELLKIEKWIKNEKQKAISNKTIGKKSIKKQTKMETLQRLSIPIED